MVGTLARTFSQQSTANGAVMRIPDFSRFIRRDGRSINRAPSPVLARGMPWASVALATIAPQWLTIASAPLLPPLGFLLFLSWRQLRPGLLPVWSGLPLGLLDDLFSGQPPGSAVLLWSAAAIVLDYIEARLPWRNARTDWLFAAGMIAAYILLCLLFANLAGASTPVQVVLPQIAMSILCYPLIDRLVASLDRLRLIRFMEIR